MSSKRKAEAGHRDHFGSPAGKGWPTFGPDGKIVKPAAPVDADVIYIEPCRSPFGRGVCGASEGCAAVCLWGRS